ncbi:MAG TPA: SDR family NAD(P)-dependent oxidoreductase [Terriglobia bacterium]|nr:SDR family NAD(P)-dependent oxidoreductase [Terriglobia bacterium]
MSESQFCSLSGKVAIVTGAARGIGAAITERFLKAGATVVLADLDEAEAQKTARSLDPEGQRSLVAAVDINRWAAVESLAKRVEDRFGKIDILVNNAGIAGANKPMVEVSEEEWDQVSNINLKGVFLCCKAVLPVMLRNRYGKIVNIASIAGKEGNPNLTAYSATKAGVIGLTKALAKEVCTQGLYVNCVTPAVIETPILKQVTQELINYMTSRIPMGRVGQPAEVAALVHFLASDDCSFTNGACVDISGGRATY